MNPSLAMALLVLLPLTAAALAFVWPRAGRWLGRATVALAALGVARLAKEVMGREGLVHRVGGWGAPLGIDLRADGLAALMLALTTIMGLAAVLYAPSYFSAHQQGRNPPAPPGCPPGRDGATETKLAGTDSGLSERWFWPLFLFLWASLNALFLSGDIFNLYVTLELLGFSAVALVALGGGRDALAAAMRYLLTSLAASLFYLLGVALVYGQCGTVDLSLLADQAEPTPALWTALILMTCGLAAKAALFPLHFWLPAAHSNAPAPVSALLSALVVKGAFYILLRLWFQAFAELRAPGLMQALGGLGAAAVLWGAARALRQNRLKLLVAYSTVAQLGYLFLVFPLVVSAATGLGAWTGALLFLAAHACAKTAMFLAAGNIIQAAGHDRLPELDGIGRALPVSAFAIGLAGISLVGLPPSGGFVGKWLLLNASLSQGQWWWVAVILAGSLLAAGYLLRVLNHAFVEAPRAAVFQPAPPVMEWTAFGFALLAVLLGLGAGWPAELLRAGAPVAGPLLTGGGAP